MLLALFLAQAFAEPIIVQGNSLNQKTLLPHYETSLIAEEEWRGIAHLDDIIRELPGLTSAGGTSRSRYFQIRGIGERSSYEGMPNESVTVTLDEVDYTGVGGVLSGVGLEAVEVYKGPQNTLIGPSSLAGSLRGFSQNPYYYKGKSTASINLGSFHQRELKVSSTKSFKNYSATLSAGLNKGNGYFKNSYLNRDDTNNIDERILKFSLNKIRERDKFQAHLHYFNFKNGYDVFNLANSKTTQSEDPGKDHQETMGASFIHERKMSIGQLKSIFAGHRTKTLYAYDEDWAATTSYDYRIAFEKDHHSFQWEERLTWNTPNLSHNTGAFLKGQHQNSRELGFNGEVVRKNLQATFKRRKIDIYHESELATQEFSPFLGFRYSKVFSYYSDNNGIQLSPDDSLWGAHIGVKKESSQGLTALRLSRGFKAGGINIGSHITNERRQFKSESLYQLSFINQWKRDSLDLKLTLFGTYRKDIQVKTSFQDNPSDPSSFTFYTDNATTGVSYGLETEGKINILPSYQIQFRGIFMDSRYGNYQYGSRNLKEREFSYAPNYQVFLRHHLDLKSGIFLEWENNLTDRFFFGNSHDEMSPQSLTSDLTVGYKGKVYEIQLWTKNLFQERTETRGFYFGNRPPSYQNERFVQVGPPRTVGVTFLIFTD